MTAAKVWAGGAYHDVANTGIARIGGAWVDFGPGAPAGEVIVWPTPPSLTDGVDDDTYNLGLQFSLSGSGSWIGNEWNPAPLSFGGVALGQHYAQAWDNTGTLLTPSKAFTPAAGVKNTVLFDTPVAVTSGGTYVATIYTRHYVFLSNGSWDELSPSGRIHADRGRLRTDNSGTAAFPDGSFDAIYFISPIIVFPS